MGMGKNIYIFACFLLGNILENLPFKGNIKSRLNGRQANKWQQLELEKTL